MRSNTEDSLQKGLLVIDSGVGGLSIAEAFMQHSQIPVVYIADTHGFPYGTKTQSELMEMLTSLIHRCIDIFGIQRIIIACNTATVIGIAQLRENYPECTFIGTVPPIKMLERYATHTRFGLLASETTASHTYAKRLHRLFSAKHHMLTIPATELIGAIESCAPQWDHPRVLAEVEGLSEIIRSMNVDVVVHGCTHFFHVIPLFQRHLPQVDHLDAVHGVINRVQSLFKEISNREKPGTVKYKAELYTTSDVDQAKWNATAKVFDLVWKGSITAISV